MDRKFIEWDMPLKEISEESAREKNIRHGHPSTLHIWWARRPLASSRATNFASLIDLPESHKEREEIKELIKDITPWEAVKNGNSEAVKRAREKVLEQYDEPPKVLDPFAGGGSIPLEALRLGCETYASDYNPVAVFIEKATLEWPQKYGVDIEIPIEDASERELKNAGYTKTQIKNIREGTHKSLDDEETVEVNLLAHLVEKYANKVLEEAREEIGEFYPEENAEGLVGEREIEHEEGWIPVGYLWTRTIPCQNPNCDAEIPLIRQFWLSKKKNKKIAYRPVVNENEATVDFETLTGEDLNQAIEDGFDPKEGTVSRANAECLVCGQVTKAKQVRNLGKKGKINQRLVAVVLHHPEESGKKYRLVEKKDENAYRMSKDYLKEKLERWEGIGNPIPNETLPPDGTLGFRVNKYGITKWENLFNPRQKLAIITLMSKIKNSYENILKDCKELKIEEYRFESEDLAKSIMGYLGITLDMHSAFNNMNARWENTSEAIKHLYSRQALPMMWDYVEVNPFSGSSGTVESGLPYYLKFIKFASFDSESSLESKNIKNLSATSLSNNRENWENFDAVFTDPPYYDNVPYADLSDFFYIWLKRCVGDFFPEIFSTPKSPKSKEAIAESTRQNNPEEFFENMLSDSFNEIYQILKPNGIATVVYAHKTTEGWETILNSLIEAGFVVTASWPIHTEMKSRLRAAASAALASSIYMVCRKMEREEIGFWKDIKPQIKDRVEEKLHQFWNEGIVGGDFFISAIGPGMEIYSKYERVERYSGDEVTTKDLLEYIRSITTDYVVDTLLKDASSTEVDSASQFYLAYRWTYLDNKVEFDDARRIASGMGVELDNFSGDDGFVKQSRKYTRVLGPQDREEVERIDNMVDVMHKAVLLWDEGKQDEIKELLSTTGYGEKPAFWQFCQAVAETLMNGNKEKQLLEGFLMGRDKYSKSDKDDEQTGLDQYGVN